MRTFCLVSCVGKKLPHQAKAEDLYQSQWFKLAVAYAKANCEGWAILSAEHGIVYPWELLEPYEKTLNNMPIKERKTWAKKVIYDLANTNWEHLVILAGKRYREFIVPWLGENGYNYEVPMEGLGIGQQLKWLKESA